MFSLIFEIVNQVISKRNEKDGDKEVDEKYFIATSEFSQSPLSWRVDQNKLSKHYMPDLIPSLLHVAIPRGISCASINSIKVFVLVSPKIFINVVDVLKFVFQVE